MANFVADIPMHPPGHQTSPQPEMSIKVGSIIILHHSFHNNLINDLTLNSFFSSSQFCIHFILIQEAMIRTMMFISVVLLGASVALTIILLMVLKD